MPLAGNTTNNPKYHHRKYASKWAQAGFTLIELSIVLMVLAMMTAGTLKVSSVRTDSAKIAQLDNKLNTIEEALLTFRKAHDRLPCPADATLPPQTANFGYEAANNGTCTGGTPAANFGPDNESVAGTVPTKTLGLPDSYIFDPWGRKITYAVDRRITETNAFTNYPITSSSIGDVIIKDASGNNRTTKAIVALVSHGKNGHGAYTRNGTRFGNSSVNTDEQDNCNCNSSAVATAYNRQYVQKRLTLNPANELDTFDDVVRYKLRWQFRSAEEDSITGISDGNTSLSLVVSHNSAPNITTYSQTGQTFTKITDSAWTAADNPQDISLSSDNTYLARASTGGDKLEVYKQQGDNTFNLLASGSFSSLPGSGDGNAVAFSRSGDYLAAAGGFTPTLWVYTVDSATDTFTKIPDGDINGGFPSGTPQDIAWSLNDEHLYVVSGSSPYFFAYVRSNDIFDSADVTISGGNPAGSAYGVASSADSTYVAVAHATSPYVTIYKADFKSSPQTLTKVANPSDLPTGTAHGVTFSPDDKLMVVAHDTSPYITVYQVDSSTDTFTKVTDPLDLPTGNAWSVDFTPDSEYMAVAHHTSPYVTLYKVDTNTSSFTKVNDPLTVPTSDAEQLVFYNQPTEGPYITSVEAPSNGTYTSGMSLIFKVIFNAPIQVNTGGGTPYLSLGIGPNGSATAKQAAYDGIGNGTTELLFKYTVGSPDSDISDGVELFSPILRNSGTIKGLSGLNARLDFTSPDLSSVLVCTSGPVINSVTWPSNGNYTTGNNIDTTVVFSDAVDVNTGGGTPRIELDVGGSTKYATYLSGTGTTNITFRYTVGAADSDADGIGVTLQPVNQLIDLNGGTINGSTGCAVAATLTYTTPIDLSGVKANAAVPTIITITPPADGSYADTDVWDFSFQYDEIVNVTGTPQLEITLDSGTVYADYISGSGTDTIVFRYTVQAADDDSDGIVMVSPLGLNGGTIKNAFGTVDADLNFAVPDTSGMLVDNGGAGSPDMTNLVLWYDAADSGTITLEDTDRVAQWDDKSGNTSCSGACNLTASTTLRPYYSASRQLNGVNVVDFDGSNAIASAAFSAAYSQPNSVYVVGQFDDPTGASGNNTMFGTDDNNSQLLYNVTPGNYRMRSGSSLTAGTVISTPAIFSALFNDGLNENDSRLYENGTLEMGPGSTNNYTLGPKFVLGSKQAIGYHELDGFIAEVLVYDALHNDTQREQVECYLSNKWGITIGHGCAGAAPTITSVTPPADGNYTTGQDLDFTVNWSENMDVTGTPRIEITLDSGTVYADYVSGTGTSAHIYTYTVGGGDSDADGIVLVSPLDLNGGTVKSSAASTDGTLTFSVPDTSGITINSGGGTLYVYSAGLDNKVRKIDASTGTAAWTYSGFSGDLLAVSADTDGNVYAGGTETDIHKIDADGNWVWTNSDHGNPIESIAVDTDDSAIYSGDSNGVLKKINASTGAEVWSVTLNSPEGNNSIHVDDTYVYTGNDTDEFYKRNKSDGSAVCSNTSTFTDGIESVVLDSSGNIYVGDRDNKVYKLNSNCTSACTYSPGGSTTEHTKALAVDSSDNIYAASTDGNIRKIDSSCSLVSTFSSIHASDIFAVKLDSDGNIYSGSMDNTVKQSNSSGTVQWTNSDHTDDVTAVALWLDSGGSAPTITSVTPPADGNYTTGQDLDFTVNWSENMDVTGTPRIEITLTSGTVYATYASGTGTSAHVYTYTVGGADSDSNGIVLVSPLQLNSGTIKSSATSTDGTLTYSVPNTSGITINHIPSITSVTPPADGNYNTGQQLDFTVNWSENMTVTGIPRIALTFNTGTVYALYTSGTGTSAHTYRYTVGGGDFDNNGIVNSSPVDLNGGTIKNGGGTDGTLTFSVPDTSGITINFAIPSISSVTPPPNNTYVQGENLEFTVNWSENMNVTGTPRIQLTIGATTRYATYVSGTGTSAHLYRYTVQSGDSDSNGIASVSPLQLNGGTIKNGVGTDGSLVFTPPNTTGVLVDAVAPSITSITPPSNATYVYNDNMNFVVNWDENVIVTGTPRLELDIGGTTKYATYLSGTGTSALTFRYTVECSLSDANGVDTASPLDLNSGTIKDAAGNNGTLTFSGSNYASVLVDSASSSDPVLSIGHTTSPYVSIYNNACGTFTKLSNPASLPTGNGRSTSWSHDNVYMAVAHTSSPRVTIYKWNGTTFTKLSNPASLPASDAYGTDFSHDSVYLGVAHATSPYITIYKRSGDTFTKLSNPSSLPTGTGNDVEFSHDATYMAVAHNTSPYVTIYRRAADTFTKLSNPATLPTGNANGAAFSHNATYLAVAHATSPYVTIYKRSSDTFTKLSNPATLPTSTGNDVEFSHDSTYLAVAHTSSPYVTIYKRSGDTFTKLSNPSTLPTGTGNGAAFSYDSSYMAVGHATSPYMTVYSRSGDTFTKLSNPASLPASTGENLSFITGITSISRPEDGNYNTGENLDFYMNFPENATVASGTPRVSTTIGSTTRYATYVSGSGSSRLLFRYTVQASDSDTDGIAVNPPLQLNSSTITLASGSAADLNFTAPLTDAITVNNGGGPADYYILGIENGEVARVDPSGSEDWSNTSSFGNRVYDITIDGGYAYGSDKSGNVCKLDVTDGSEQCCYSGLADRAYSIAVDSTYIYVGYMHGDVYQLNKSNCAYVDGNNQDSPDEVFSMQADPNGDIFWSGGMDTIRKADPGNMGTSADLSGALSGTVHAITGDGTYVYVAPTDEIIYKFDATDLTTEITGGGWPVTTGHTLTINDMQYHDGYIYTASDDGYIKKINVSTGAVSTFANVGMTLQGIDVDGAGNVFVTDSSSSGGSVYDSSGVFQSYYSASSDSYGIAVPK